MAMTPFTHRNTTGQPGGSTMLDRILDDLIKTFDSIVNLVTNDALVNVQFGLAGVPVHVYHGLGRAPKTVEVVRLNSQTAIWEDFTNTNMPTYVVLSAGVNNVKATIRFT